MAAADLSGDAAPEVLGCHDPNHPVTGCAGRIGAGGGAGSEHERSRCDEQCGHKESCSCHGSSIMKTVFISNRGPACFQACCAGKSPLRHARLRPVVPRLDGALVLNPILFPTRTATLSGAAASEMSKI